MRTPFTSRAFMIFVALLVAVLATWARDAVFGTLRVDDVGTFVQKLWPTFVVGAAFVVIAFSYEKIRQISAPSLDVVLRASIALHVVAALALPLTSNDVFSNLAYGRLAALGHNPYVTTPAALDPADPFAVLVGSRWRSVPIVYGPIATKLDELVALPGRVVVALVLFKLAILAAVVASLVVAHRACRSMDPARAAKSFAIYAFSPVIFWELSSQAHNDALMVLALVVFVAAASRDREWVAVIALVLGVFAKFAAAPVLVLYLVAVARRSVARASLLALVALALSALLALVYWRDLDALRGPLATLGGAAPRTSRSFVDLFFWCAYPLGLHAQKIAYAAGWWIGTCFLGVLGIRALVTVRSFRDVVHHSLLLYLAYCVVATPWFQPWYVTWLMPLAMVHDDERWQRVVARYGALTPVQYILPFDPLTTIALDVYTVHMAWPLLRVARKVER